ncbi:HEAT repeat domain-containing protein [Oscillatoria sp. CS-180]|uniref:HEAT repeat domain-containing protein n=1 Tax=Oscillatoria sp. CS-180 TaxID=3021720 RepID=UPI00233075DC|nr:HEAT repeat domain-containing protein [Oscillatoria sp. CS-180]MDB9529209.1 HEAT repeat domain-containing protein [Oscillatoria sp. CS-180]
MTDIEITSDSLTTEEAIANLQQTEDSSLRYYAAWWLGRFRVNQPVVIAALEAALQDTDDRSPDGGYPLRRNAARALGKLGDRSVVPALIECLACEDYYVREAAAQALAELEDTSCASALLTLLEGGLSAATQVPDKPHLVQPYGAVIEALGMLGVTDAIAAIQPFLDHEFATVQNAAARALYQLTGDEHYAERLITTLRGESLQLRRSALMDLGAVGYLPAAEAIAAALTENSLKLIAMKGLIDTHLTAPEGSPPELTNPTIEVMNLMDNLL